MPDPEAEEGLVEDTQDPQPPHLPHYEVPADLQANVPADSAPPDVEETPTEPQGTDKGSQIYRSGAYIFGYVEASKKKRAYTRRYQYCHSHYHI